MHHHHIKNKFIQSQFAERLPIRGNNTDSELGIADVSPPVLPPQGIPLSLYFSVIKNTMMNAYYFQMNNLGELAADKANSCS